MTDYEPLKAYALIALPVIAWLAIRYRHGRPWWRRPATWALLVLAILSVTNYVRWEAAVLPHGIEPYDVYHYYIGGKYRSELGTERLYACSLVADAERRKPGFRRVSRVRDLRDYRVVRKRWMVEQASNCPEFFSEQRWREFKSDLRYFQRVNRSRRNWNRIFIDRGTNASPIWHVVGGMAARLIPTEHILWATRIDVVALLIGLGFVVWAFGLDVGLVSLVFLTCCFSTRWPHIGGALLRYDWVAAAMISVCLLRRGRTIASGAALALSAGLRLFPVLLFVGLGARGVRELIATRRFATRQRRVLIGFAVAFGLLGTLAMIDGGGLASVQEFTAKIRTHAAPEHVSVMRMGLAVAAAWRGETSAAELPPAYLAHKRRLVAEQDWAVKLFALSLLLLLVWVSPHLKDRHLVLLGFAFIPLALQASYYYFVLLVVPLLLHTDRLSRWPHVVALFLLTWGNAAMLFANSAHAHRYLILAPASVVLSLYALAVFAAAIVSGARRARVWISAATPAPGPR